MDNDTGKHKINPEHLDALPKGSTQMMQAIKVRHKATGIMLVAGVFVSKDTEGNLSYALEQLQRKEG